MADDVTEMGAGRGADHQSRMHGARAKLDKAKDRGRRLLKELRGRLTSSKR